MSPLKAGDTAPKFSLPDRDGEEINLADFGTASIGLFLSEGDDAGLHRASLRPAGQHGRIEKVGVEVLGISTDKPEKLSRFAEKELLNFTLLSDEDHQVAQQFGVWGEKTFMGKTYDGIHRISFLIDGKGKIEKVFDDFKTTNHHDIVLSYLQQ